jgi:enamine deaminase RidA (YjgF/YER057c/UK114 family)
MIYRARRSGMSNRARVERRSVSSGTPWEEKYGYSRGVRVGDRILVSGTTATGPEGLVAKGDPAGQARYALDKIEKAIRDLGGTLGDVVRTRIYIARMEDWKAVAEVHGDRFGKIRPANTLVRADLVGDGFLVEIEAEAVVGSDRADE